MQGKHPRRLLPVLPRHQINLLIENMLKSLVKTGMACGLHWSGMDRWIGKRFGPAGMPLVISYHRVVENFRRSAMQSLDPMLVSIKTLERHLDWIGKRYDYISLDELGLRMQNGENFRRPVASITFDDGYSDVYENGYPILTRKGIPSAVFVVTDRVNTKELHAHDGLYLWVTHALSSWKSPRLEMMRLLDGLDVNTSLRQDMIEVMHDAYKFTRLCLARLEPDVIEKIISGIAAVVEADEDLLREFYSMNWDMLREMSRHDVTVGSHTKTHKLLINESGQNLIDETASSKQAIERILGMAADHFAYPDGRFNPAVVHAVKQAGYRYAYTTCNHRDTIHPLLTIPRRVMWENTCLDAFSRFSPAIMSCQVNGVFDRLRGCRQTHSL